MIPADNGRHVYVCTRTKSQTVNICDANNRRGDYDWIVRLFQPDVVTEAEIEDHKADPESLVQWLTEEKHGQIERRPPPDLPPDQPPHVPNNGPVWARDAEWIGVAIMIVEQAIDQFVREFLRVPYLHRVEHSLHARLYGILATQPHFARELPLKTPNFLSQPVHKEWPETKPQENTRRGNFDLAVLTPEQLAGCTVDAFTHGNLRAPIVIEMGLDYGAAHLAADRDKLIHSEVPYGYLVHLTRIGRIEQAEAIIRNPGGNGRVKTAYACVADNVKCHKLVNCYEIEEGPGNQGPGQANAM